MRVFVVIILIAAAAGMTWRYPLFHIVPLGQASADGQEREFDAEKFVANFWTQQLTPKLADAADAVEVFAALKAGAAAARKEYGRTVGMSRSTFFLIQGQGTIVVVEKSRIGVTLGDSPTDVKENPPDLWLAMGPIFGNAVRDASGVLRSQDFPNSQNFNELSAAFNAYVEKQIQPKVRDGAKPGRPIRFVACVEVLGGTAKQPLTLIPLQATIE